LATRGQAVVGHLPFWPTAGLPESQFRSAFGAACQVDGLAAAYRRLWPRLQSLWSDDGGQEESMHGDLHLDNIRFAPDGAICIYDFDVTRQQQRGRDSDLGVALHRTARTIAVERGSREPDAGCVGAIRTLSAAYAESFGARVDPVQCLLLAADESLRKMTSAFEHSHAGRHASAWRRLFDNHIAYFIEIDQLLFFEAALTL
ncbi:MAG TPA: hypothetical protein VIP11_06515, partial [Gemmatimonadaceae bacterium]